MKQQKPSLTIIKIGGKIVENEEALNNVLQQFAQIGGRKILIHGGGKAASAWSQKIGITPQMIDGRRVTDEATLEVVTMVYAGLYNKKIVSKLQAIPCNALGLTGADLNTIQSHMREVKEIDYGLVGDVDYVHTSILEQLLDNQVVPVFCAITHDKKGQLLNTNADTIASELASALAKIYEVTLKYCFEKKGVLSDPEDDDAVFPTISFSEFEKYKSEGVISDGMIPKIDNAFFALKNNVKEVFICGCNTIEKADGTLIQL